MTQSFGVTTALIQSELTGSDLSGLSADITRWASQYGAPMEMQLRRLAFDVAEVAALGDTDSLYLMAQAYVTHMVTARCASALSWADPEKTAYHIAQAESIEAMLRALPDVSTEAIERTDVLESKAPKARPRANRPPSRWLPGGRV